MDGKFSSHHRWKNKYFFVIGQWEFHHTETVKGPRVPQETSASAANASKEPQNLKKELKRVNDVLTWAQKHESLMSHTKLIERATEGVGFTSFEKGDGWLRRGPAPCNT